MRPPFSGGSPPSILDVRTQPTREKHAALADRVRLREEVDLGSDRELERALPWAYQFQQMLCGD